MCESNNPLMDTDFFRLQQCFPAFRREALCCGCAGLFQPGAETQGAARDIDHAGRSERDFSRAFQDRGRRA